MSSTIGDKLALRACCLGKCYRVFGTRRDLVKHILKSPLARLRISAPPGGASNAFWALQDVNLELARGEVLGVLGRNGSGKSTLLQLICGTLTPTTGFVEVGGRIAALLELGAGFNPDFTGRENVMLSCSIAGLSERETLARFDRIVDFSELWDFIDRPVRTYSSGMYVRLAFAAAVHVDPCILVVDEALSVGDAKFQKKCLDHMNALKSDGTTIILVSHDYATVKTFATRGLVLNKGVVQFSGSAGEAATAYLGILFPKGDSPGGGASAHLDTDSAPGAVGSYRLSAVPGPKGSAYGRGGAELTEIRILGLGQPNILRGRDELTIELRVRWDRERIQRIIQETGVQPNLLFGIRFETSRGFVINDLATSVLDGRCDVDPLYCDSGTLTYKVRLPFALAKGDYFLSPAIALGRQNHLEPLAEYTNLVHLKSEPSEATVLGQLRYDFDASFQETEASVGR